jgi:hypothetical protein
MRQIVILIFLFGFSNICYSQLAKTDTVLYLYFDKGEIYRELNYSGRITKVYANGIYSKYERDGKSIFHPILKRNITLPDSYEIRAHEFEGLTKDGYDRVEPAIIKLNDLRKFPVVTLDQLNEFLKLNYKERMPWEYRDTTYIIIPEPDDPQGALSFWVQLKHIFIVEKNLKSRTATITEVRIVGNEM